MKEHFMTLDRTDRKVAWCTSVGPAEILRAMGFEVFFPENHGAMLGATRACMDTIPVAHTAGYAPEICSYLTSDIGAHLKGATPLTKAYGIAKVPRPDVLVYNTNQCKDVMHWFEYYGREFKVPVLGIHSPNVLVEVERCHIDDVAAQFKRLILALEKIIGAKLIDGELERVLSLSKEATDLWSQVLATAKHKPSPLTFFDATIFMGPIVVLRGTSAAKDYYSALLGDLKENISRGVAAVPGEQKRIYWDGMPVWGRLRSNAELFKENKTCVAASTYCNSWVFSAFDPADPLTSMAESYLSIFINRNDAYKEKYIEEIVREFSLDGVLFHNSRTCPNNTNSQYNLPGRLRMKGIPSVVIDGDLCDLRCYSDEQSATVIESFLENIIT